MEKLYYRNIEQQKIEALKTLKGNFDINIKQLSSASLSDYVIYTDAKESGWGTHGDINSIGGGGG